jgi:hypothetical protein
MKEEKHKHPHTKPSVFNMIVLVILIIAVSYIAFITKNKKPAPISQTNIEVKNPGHEITSSVTIEIQP